MATHLSPTNCWEGESADTIKVTWDKLATYETYFLQWALDTASNPDGTFKTPIGKVGSSNFSNAVFTDDSLLIRVSADSLRARKIYVKLWAQNQYGTSLPALDSGYTKLAELTNLAVSQGSINDSLQISFSQPAKSNIASFGLILDSLGADFASPEKSITAMAGADTTIEIAHKGYIYRVGAYANSELVNAGSDTVWAEGYSKIPAPVGVEGDALENGNNKIKWEVVGIGDQDTVRYNIYRQETGKDPLLLSRLYYDAPVNDTMSFTDDKAMPGNNYDYYLRAYAADRPYPFGDISPIESDTSSHASLLTQIGAVSGFVQDTTMLEQPSAVLYWEQRGDLSDYNIYFSRWADTATAKIKSLSITDNNFYVKITDSLTDFPGMLWHFWIRAKSNGGSELGQWTPNDNDGLLVYTLPSVPAIDQVEEGASADSIHLNWSKSDYSKYAVEYRKSDETVWTKLADETDTSVSVFAVTDNLSPGVKYDFRVAAKIDKDTVSPMGPANGKYGRTVISDYSAIKKGYLRFDTVAAFKTYNAPDSIKTDRIVLYWEKSEGSNVVYTIYRSESSDTASATALTSVVDEDRYEDVRYRENEAPLPGKAYYYWITAKKSVLANSESKKQPLKGAIATGYNNVDSAWTKFIAPSGLDASGEFSPALGDNIKQYTYSDSIVIKWNEIPAADSFWLRGRSGDDLALDTVVSDTSVCWTGMQGGIVYSFEVSARNDYVGKDNPAWSNRAFGFATLPAPTNVELEQDSLNDGIRISFDTVLGAEKYIVYSSTPTQSLYQKVLEIAQQNKARLDSLDQNPLPGDTAWYFVRSFNSRTGSSDSSIVVDTVYPVTPPNGLRASKGEKLNSVEVEWSLDHRTRGIDSFRVYRDTLGGEMEEADYIQTVKSFSGLTHKISDMLGAETQGKDTLFSGQKYSYAIKSYANGYASSFTLAENVDTGWVALPIVSQVSGSFAQAGSPISVSWTAGENISEEVSYIYRRVTRKVGAEDTIYVDSTGGKLISDTTISDNDGLQAGMVYAYQVKAFNSKYVGVDQGADEVWSNKSGQELGSRGMISSAWSPIGFAGQKFDKPTLYVVNNFDSLKVDTIFLKWEADDLVTDFVVEVDTSADFGTAKTLGIPNNSERSFDQLCNSPIDLHSHAVQIAEGEISGRLLFELQIQNNEINYAACGAFAHTLQNCSLWRCVTHSRIGSWAQKLFDEIAWSATRQGVLAQIDFRHY